MALSRHALKDSLNINNNVISKGAKKKKSLLSADLKEGITATTKKIHGIPVSYSGGTKAKSRKGKMLKLILANRSAYKEVFDSNQML